jgi:ABC-2 type transport system ATP-binding protein
VIEVRNLTKRYGDLEAVRGISFSVGKDQVLGFLGPNGAGKTTVMRVLTGYHFPSSGEVLVDGLSVEEEPEEVKRRTGYLPENLNLYGGLTVEEYLAFVVRARGIRRQDRREAMERSIRLCGLGPVRSRRIEALSKGFKQRAGLAQAIIHDPPLLILDEPSSGLDPNQIIEMRSLIRELGKRKTVILSTHILQEAEAVCQEVLILNEGRIAAQGRPGEIAASLAAGGDSWELLLKGPGEIRGALARLGERLGGGLRDLELLAGEQGAAALRFSLPAGDGSAGERIFEWAVAEGFKVLGMNRKALSLEGLFVRLTRDGPPGGEK